MQGTILLCLELRIMKLRTHVVWESVLRLTLSYCCYSYHLRDFPSSFIALHARSLSISIAIMWIPTFLRLYFSSLFYFFSWGLPPVTFRIFLFVSTISFLISWDVSSSIVRLLVSFFISFLTTTTMAPRRLHSILDKVPHSNMRDGGQISADKGRIAIVCTWK